MKLTLGASIIGIDEQMTVVGDSITLTAQSFDGWGNMGCPNFKGALAVYRKEYTHVMLWDVNESHEFSIIRVIEDEPVMIPIADDPIEVQIGDAIVFGIERAFVIWLEGYSLIYGHGEVSREEWCAVFGGD